MQATEALCWASTQADYLLSSEPRPKALSSHSSLCSTYELLDGVEEQVL